MSERNREGHVATYLGDGAYAAFDGFAVHVYTDNGERVTNRVVLEPEHLAALIRFLADRGLKMKVQP